MALNRASHPSFIEIRLGQGDLTNKVEFIHFVCDDFEFLQATKKQFNLGDLPCNTTRLSLIRECERKVAILRVTPEEYNQYFLGKNLEIQMESRKIPFSIPQKIDYHHLLERRNKIKTIIVAFENKIKTFCENTENKKIIQSENFFQEIYKFLTKSTHSHDHYINHPSAILKKLTAIVEEEKKSFIKRFFLIKNLIP